MFWDLSTVVAKEPACLVATANSTQSIFFRRRNGSGWEPVSYTGLRMSSESEDSIPWPFGYLR